MVHLRRLTVEATDLALKASQRSRKASDVGRAGVAGRSKIKNCRIDGGTRRRIQDMFQIFLFQNSIYG